MERICELDTCGQPLGDGKRSDARYCSRAHKQAAVRRRQKLAAGPRHELCDECGAPYFGFPPYCPEHETEGTAA